MNNFALCSEEIKLYDNVIQLLEWSIKPNNELFADFCPVISGGKRLIRFCENTQRFDRSKYITFKPLRNNKHAQYLVDFLLNDEEQLELLTGKHEEKGYKARVVNLDGDELAKSDYCRTEVEAKFMAFYRYYFKKCRKEFLAIRKFDDEHAPKDVKPKGKGEKK